MWLECCKSGSVVGAPYIVDLHNKDCLTIEFYIADLIVDVHNARTLIAEHINEWNPECGDLQSSNPYC